MPINKNAFRRYQVIDQVIRNRQGATKNEIMKAVIHATQETYSEKQFYNDINTLMETNPKGTKELGWNCPIDKNEKGKFYYTDPEFSLTRITFTTPDRVTIETGKKLLKNLKGIPLFRDLETILDRLSEHINDELAQPTMVRTDPFIVYEDREYKGIEFLNILLTNAALKKRIQLEYKDYFDKKSQHLTIEPYLLKEYKNRWYCIAKNKYTQAITSFALDRMLSIKSLDDEAFLIDTNFSYEDFFKYTYGISTPGNLKPQFKNDWKPQRVKLRFDALQKNYIKALPLHKSQQIAKETNSYMDVIIEVYITIELIRDLRAFGPRVKVISPKNLLQEYWDFEENYPLP